MQDSNFKNLLPIDNSYYLKKKFINLFFKLVIKFFMQVIPSTLLEISFHFAVYSVAEVAVCGIIQDTKTKSLANI